MNAMKTFSRHKGSTQTQCRVQNSIKLHTIMEKRDKQKNTHHSSRLQHCKI